MPDLFAFLDNIPEYYLAIAIYLGGSLFVLWLWYFIARALPRPIGGMSWVFLFAVLLSPTITEGTNAKIAPAIVGLMFGFLTDEKHLIWSNLVPILFVSALGFFLGYLWNKYQEYQQPAAE